MSAWPAGDSGAEWASRRSGRLRTPTPRLQVTSTPNTFMRLVTPSSQSPHVRSSLARQSAEQSGRRSWALYRQAHYTLPAFARRLDCLLRRQSKCYSLMCTYITVAGERATKVLPAARANTRVSTVDLFPVRARHTEPRLAYGLLTNRSRQSAGSVRPISGQRGEWARSFLVFLS